MKRLPIDSLNVFWCIIFPVLMTVIVGVQYQVFSDWTSNFFGIIMPGIIALSVWTIVACTLFLFTSVLVANLQKIVRQWIFDVFLIIAVVCLFVFYTPLGELGSSLNLLEKLYSLVIMICVVLLISTLLVETFYKLFAHHKLHQSK